MLAHCSDLNLKVILVGESGCGKSSILQRFTRGLFSEQTQSTIAVDFQIKNTVFASKKVAVQVWDTGARAGLCVHCIGGFSLVDRLLYPCSF